MSFTDSVSRSINNNAIMKTPLTKMHICDSRVRIYNGTRLKLHIKILDFNSKLVFLLGMSDPATICQRIDSPSVSALNKKLILSSPSPFLSNSPPSFPLKPYPQGMSQPNKQRNQLQENPLSRFHHCNSSLDLLTRANVVIR